LVKIGIIQTDIELGNKENNVKRAIEKIEMCSKEGVDIAVFPELWNTGYSLNNIYELAEDSTGETLKLMQEAARKTSICIVAGSVPELGDDRKLYNTSYSINRNGEIVGKYRKVHLFTLMKEEKYFSPGDSFIPYNFGYGLMGTTICYDIRFPEIYRKLAKAGACLVFLPAEFPYPRLNHWRILIQARAIENQIFFVAANRVGIGYKDQFFGHSMIVDPWGEIICEGNDREQLLIAEINLKLVDEVRNKIPCWSDIREDLY
jgi:predicted amidohydrolase